MTKDCSEEDSGIILNLDIQDDFSKVRFQFSRILTDDKGLKH